MSEYVVCNGDIETIKALVKAGADMNVKDKVGYTDLIWAAMDDKATLKWVALCKY